MAPVWFSLVLGALFLFAVIDVWVRTTSTSHIIRRGMNLLGTVEGPKGFFREYNMLRERFVKETIFAGAWKEFDKTLIMDRAREIVLTSRRPHEFFHEITLLSPRINLRLTNAIPGYLISLGLFFTFIGLVVAIAIAARGMEAAGDVAQTQAALAQLLQVASLKFITSVAGISLSLLLSAWQKMLLNNVQRNTYRFCTLMEARTQLVTMEQLMFDWIRTQSDTSQKLGHMADDIATEVALKMAQPNMHAG